MATAFSSVAKSLIAGNEDNISANPSKADWEDEKGRHPRES